MLQHIKIPLHGSNEMAFLFWIASPTNPTIPTTSPPDNPLSKRVDYPINHPLSDPFLTFLLPVKPKMAPEKTKSAKKASETVATAPITSLRPRNTTVITPSVPDIIEILQSFLAL
ncbi:hypothetical protein PS6_010072 [Mucor atramentarius]